ncbi:hypothetical protein ACA910_018913 [Epithemia clementina (nom. ined.)]
MASSLSRRRLSSCFWWVATFCTPNLLLWCPQCCLLILDQAKAAACNADSLSASKKSTGTSALRKASWTTHFPNTLWLSQSLRQEEEQKEEESISSILREGEQQRRKVHPQRLARPGAQTTRGSNAAAAATTASQEDDDDDEETSTNNKNNKIHSGPVAGMSESALFVPTPIDNWAPSWVASLGQGSVVVAMECVIPNPDNDSNETNQSALLLLIRHSKSPSPSSSLTARYKENDGVGADDARNPIPNGKTVVGGVKMQRVQEWSRYYHATSQQPTQPPQQKRHWKAVSPTVLCAMTGFLPDVDYLHRRLQTQWEVHNFIYPALPAQQTTTLDIQTMAQALGQWTREYLDTYQRPLGMQALLMGMPRTSRRNLGSGSRPAPWRLYTIDPSGQVRSWNGGATVIGQQAHVVRQQLHNELQKALVVEQGDQQPQEQQTTQPKPMEQHSDKTTRKLFLSPQRALQVVVKALSRTFLKEEHQPQQPQGARRWLNFQSTTSSSEEDTDDSSWLEAWLVWQDSSNTAWIGGIEAPNHQPSQPTNDDKERRQSVSSS